MNTEVANIETLDYSQLAALTGASTRETAVLPRLSINRSPEDDSGNTLKMGTFAVTQNNVTVYGLPAIFRPFINTYQYAEYSPAEKTFTNRSLIIKSFNEEALDMKGGLACGKVAFKNLHTLSADEQARQKNIKCRRLLYGLVSLIEACTATGEKTEVSEVPVLWKLSGGGFMAPKEAFDIMDKMKHLYFQHNLKLETKKQKTGSTIYYDTVVTPELKTELTFTDDNMATFRMFQNLIDKENAWVASQWRAVKQAAVGSISDKELLSSLELNDNIDDL